MISFETLPGSIRFIFASCSPWTGNAPVLTWGGLGVTLIVLDGIWLKSRELRRRIGNDPHDHFAGGEVGKRIGGGCRGDGKPLQGNRLVGQYLFFRVVNPDFLLAARRFPGGSDGTCQHCEHMRAHTSG